MSSERPPDHTTPAGDVHISLRDISKNYGGVQAANQVNLDIKRGTVHAIVGENGAGKSTVAKIIAGVIRPSHGEMLVDGESVEFSAPRQALAAGIAMIEQELALVSCTSVVENVMLGMESHRGGVLVASDQQQRFDELIERTGFDVKADTLVETLSIAQQQKVEILRAIARDARLIIMDEPTAPLTQDESAKLYATIRSLRDEGVTIVYISHFLKEVLAISDTITVMRDGHHVSTKPAGAETEASLVRAMLGRSLELTFPDRRPCDAHADPVLEVRGLTALGRFEDVSFSVRPGEIVGMAGLIGSGRTEVLRGIFGADPIDDGEIVLDGRARRWKSPRQAIAEGVGMLPESRKDDGLVMMLPIEENLVMADLSAVSSWGLMRRGRQSQRVEQLMRDLDVRASSARAPVLSLSGGNQQKVLFAKCLMTKPKVLLVDEPTRGVDIGAKRAIYNLIVGLAESGMAIVVVSSELEEVFGLAHRLLVMRRGRLVADLSADEADEEVVLTAAFGAEEVA